MRWWRWNVDAESELLHLVIMRTGVPHRSPALAENHQSDPAGSGLERVPNRLATSPLDPSRIVSQATTTTRPESSRRAE